MSNNLRLKYCLEGIEDIEAEDFGGLDKFYAAVRDAVDFAWGSEGIEVIEAKKDTASRALRFYAEGDTSTVKEFYSRLESIHERMELGTYNLTVRWLKYDETPVRKAEPAEFSGEKPSVFEKSKYVVFEKVGYGWFNPNDFKTAYDDVFAEEINPRTAPTYIGRMYYRKHLKRRGKRGEHEFNLCEDKDVVKAYIKGFEEKYPVGVSDIWN